MSTIKAIFFDLGNVIINFDPLIAEKGYGEVCVIREGNLVDYIMGSRNMDMYMEGRLTSSQFYSKTCRIFKIKLKYGDFYRIWNSIFFPYPEMEDIVRKIRKDYPDIKLMLVSNTNEEHFNFLKKEYPVLALFDAHVVSHEVGRQKPHPDIFKAALKLSGVLPRDIFYTDDREDLIEFARTMGIKAQLFTGHQPLREQLGKYGITV
ncbi:MAG: HAD-IA family hydrolase [Candidatus Omnitrophica bacterium]|nr:HAD-IA family hydrolase [Candidatus Omnitrophota bacterium]